MSNNNVAIVTGISKGYGLAVAQQLAGDGWMVIGDARSESELAAAVRNEENIIGISGDLTDEQHQRTLLDRARKFGAVDLIVNNAGMLGPSPLPRVLSLKLDDLRDIFAVNVIAQVRMIQIAFENAAPRVVVSLSSDAAQEAYEGWGGYGASKAALDHLTKVLAVENPDSRFYSLDPGDMRTEMHQRAFPGEDISDRPLPQTAAHAIATLARGHLASGRYSASELSSVD